MGLERKDKSFLLALSKLFPASVLFSRLLRETAQVYAQFPFARYVVVLVPQSESLVHLVVTKVEFETLEASKSTYHFVTGSPGNSYSCKTDRDCMIETVS